MPSAAGGEVLGKDAGAELAGVGHAGLVEDLGGLGNSGIDG